MSLQDDPPPGKIPTIIWVGLAIVVVIIFVVITRVMNPPGIGRGPAPPHIVVPSNPPPAPLPDAKPLTSP